MTVKPQKQENPPTDSGNKPPEAPETNGQPEVTPLSEKRRKELWLYLAASIVTVEMILAVGGLAYGFIASPGRGVGAHSFPWLVWGSLSFIIPAVIILAVHQADVGLFRKPKGTDSEAEWQKQLPDRMQRLYRIIKGAPVVVVLLGVVALGAALLTIDGALSALSSFSSALTPYIPHIIGGLVAVLAVIIGAAVWLNYRTRRLYAEYEFRREVLEKTGVIIVDKGSTPLPPGGTGNVPYAVLEAGSLSSAQKALESGDIVDAEVTEVTPSEKGN